MIYKCIDIYLLTNKFSSYFSYDSLTLLFASRKRKRKR